ncbi:MAG: Cu(I)-responsive transcriptional regulator [Pseudomonadota bacterium]
MNIGEASAASGVSCKMIRHYEGAGLFPAVHRTAAGYRQYGQKEVQTLRFIRRARDLGFSIAEIAELVGLWQNRRRPSRRVKELAQTHIRDLEQKAQELLEMKSVLEHLAHCCNGDDRPECPILDELAGPASVLRPGPAASRPLVRPRGRASA